MREELQTLQVRKLIRALERDGFECRKSRGSQRVYRHPDGRRVVIHYHRGGDTLPWARCSRFSMQPIGQKTITGDLDC
jgi:predicted RNA binding protein YcfA (HicA-like mRNA interferase family)